jgi:hypothetical protein
MTTQDVNKLAVEVAEDMLRSLLSKKIQTEERILFLKAQYEEICKKKDKDLSAEEKKLKEEYQVNIDTFKEGITASNVHIENYRTIIEGYRTNTPVQF